MEPKISRVQPRLAVFGHRHVSYGREDTVQDSVTRGYEEVIDFWGAGWVAMAYMAVEVPYARLYASVFSSREKMLKAERVTTFVNASVFGGLRNELGNQRIVVDL